MTDIPTITFQCIGCDHSEEIELKRLYPNLVYAKVWVIPDPHEVDWHRNEHWQLVCDPCHEGLLDFVQNETLSTAERNPGLAGGP